MNNSGDQQIGTSNEQKHNEYIKSTQKAMNKNEKIFFLILLIITIAFIVFLPKTYKFISNINIKELFAGKPVVEEKNNDQGNNNNKQPENEEKYKAVTCTRIEPGVSPYINTTILYFSDAKLKKMSKTATYAYKDGYVKTDLNTYFLPQQSKLANQNGFEMKIDAQDEQIYTVTYNINMSTVTNDVLIELEVTDRLDSGETPTINLYKQNGFTCE